MKQFKIGLVYTPSPLTNISRWYSLLSSIGDVSLLLPHERSMRYDCIIIPDAGVNTNINAFKNKNYIAIGTEPICPFIEMFRIESLVYYHLKGVPIISVGQSRCIIYDTISQKCALVGGIPVLLAGERTEHVKVLSKVDGFIEDFEDTHIEIPSNLYGVINIQSPNLFPILKDIKSKTLLGEMDNLQTVSVPLTPKDPNPPLQEEEGW